MSLLPGIILVVSSKPLQITRHDFGGRFYAYNEHLTMALVTSVAGGGKPDSDLSGNGHGHVRVYTRLGRIKCTMHGPD